MATPSSDNVLLGRGAIFFDRYDANGVSTGFRHLGNCDQFSIGTETEKLEMSNYLVQTTAKYASVITSTNIPITISGFEFDTENLALMSLGTSSVVTQSAGTVASDEVLVPATATGLKGKFLKTAFTNISAVVLEQGANTLVLNTDYTIFDADVGVIQILASSPTVVDGAAITANYSYAAIIAGDNIKKVAGAVLSECVGKVMFVSNNSTGQDRHVIFWKVSLVPNGELGLISDEFAKFTLTGTALDDSAGVYGGSVGEPYYIMRDTKAA